MFHRLSRIIFRLAEKIICFGQEGPFREVQFASGVLAPAGFGTAGVGRVRGVGVGFPAGGVGEVFGVASGIGEAWALAFGGVAFGVGVGFTAAFAFVGTGQRYMPLGCRIQSGGINWLPLFG